MMSVRTMLILLRAQPKNSVISATSVANRKYQHPREHHRQQDAHQDAQQEAHQDWCYKRFGEHHRQQDAHQDWCYKRFGLAWGGLAGAGFALLSEETDDYEKDIKEKENRVRMYAATKQIFDYFASYQFIKENGKKVILMGPKEFYNAVTPESVITHGIGRGTYVSITSEDLVSDDLYQWESLPLPEDSVLNAICKQGLLTYTDFYFLLTVISTPRRYLEIMFHSFDVNADYAIHAREFAHVMAKVANYSGDPDDLLGATHSGLLNYLFKGDRSRILYKEDLIQFHESIINELLLLEYKGAYKSHDKKGNISEVEFCQHLLKNAPFSPKRTDRMIARVVKKFGGNENLPGISFRSFKNFHHVLFGGSDLERALFFMDTTAEGVRREEFVTLSKWVSGYDLDDHVVEVLYTLLDEENEIENCIGAKDLCPIIFEWRHARGFERNSLQILLGHHKI